MKTSMYSVKQHDRNVCEAVQQGQGDKQGQHQSQDQGHSGAARSHLRGPYPVTPHYHTS